jgi:hypothetical protein
MGHVEHAEHYVKEAERCSELGATAPNAEIARRWRALADQYIILAEAIAARARRAAVRRTTMGQTLQIPRGKQE